MRLKLCLSFGKFQLDTTEVNGGSFLSKDKVEQMIKENSHQFTDYFLEEWENLD